MFLPIARHTLVEILRDGRFRWTAAIIVALLVAAIVAGAHYQRGLVAQQRAAETAEQSRWYGQPEKNPHSAAHYGVYAFKPRLAPAFLDPGVEPYTGITVWLEAHRQNEMLFRPAEDATVAQRFGDLTVAIVLQIVLPLAVVLLAFNAFAGERERGTLRQLLSLGVRPRDLILGKMLGLGSALALIVVPALLLGAAALAFGGPAMGWGRFGMLALIYFVYLGVFLLLALAVSARAPTSRLALVGLLGFWACNCLLASRVLADLAAARHPLPEPIAFKARLKAALGDPEGAPGVLKERMAALMKQHGVTRPEDLPINLAGVRLQAGEDHGYAVFDQFYGEIFSPMEAQNRFLRRASALFPMLGVQSASMALAGTDLAQHRDFVRAAEEQRRVIQKTLNDHITAHPLKPGEVGLGDAALWAKVPSFHYTPPSLGAVLASQRLPLVLLVTWFVFAAWFAIRSAARLRPV